MRNFKYVSNIVLEEGENSEKASYQTIANFHRYKS